MYRGASAPRSQAWRACEKTVDRRGRRDRGEENAQNSRRALRAQR